MRYRIGSFEKAARALTAFSLTERIVFIAVAGIFAVSTFFLLVELNTALTIPVPTDGGSLTEGVIGVPRFINPLLAISDADRDLTALVYSGLMKVSGAGVLVGDLAESYEISENNLMYTFHIRPDATFQDGTPVTAEDVVFTIKKAQDPNIKSPRRASWEGVAIEKTNDLTVVVKLKTPYPPFLENTTIGILPSHIWKNVDATQFTFSQFNIEPIGSGPYKVASVKRTAGGIPLSYTLIPFKNYVQGKAYISSITTKFYTNEDGLIDAYERGEINSINSISPHSALALKALGARVESVPLPRVFAVFFNQDKVPAFTYPEVRKALVETLDRNRIVQEVLSGYGAPLSSPLPQSLFGAATNTERDLNAEIESARALLEKNGWKANATDGVFEKTVKKVVVRLEFTIATSNTTELKAGAKIIKENWERVGAKVSVTYFDASDLNQNVIRPRSYDALYFGEIVGRDLDMFAFWHSSQRNDPGLNVALYTNITADKLLEKARSTALRTDQIALYQEFAKEIEKDYAAAFVYSPDFVYVLPKNISGVNLSSVTIPSDRFINSNEWYIETDRVWNIFAPDETEQN